MFRTMRLTPFQCRSGSSTKAAPSPAREHWARTSSERSRSIAAGAGAASRNVPISRLTSHMLFILPLFLVRPTVHMARQSDGAGELRRWLTGNRTNCRRIRQCILQMPAVQIAGGGGLAAPRAVPIRWKGASALDRVFLQAVDERAAADPEPPRGLRLVAAGRRQRVLDLLPLESVEPLPEGHFFLRPRPLLVHRRGGGHCVQRLRADLAAGAERDEPRHGILQLSHVTRPIREAQRFQERG